MALAGIEPPAPDARVNPSSPSLPDRCGLIGAGGHAGVVAATLRRLGIALEAVFDRDPARIGAAFHGLTIQDEAGVPDLPLHIAIGSNASRRRIAEARTEARWLTIIHPDARLADDVSIAEGVLVAMGALIQTGGRLGRHVIINTGAIVEHDGVIGDFAHIAPGAVLGGGVTVGEDALVGTGAVVLPGLTIGAGATVSAGAVVTRSVAAGQTVVGVPARTTGAAA